MSMRTVNDTCGGNHTTLVDKMVGTAYDVVRYVASNLDKIIYVSENMEAIHTAATGQAIPKPMAIVSFVDSTYTLLTRKADAFSHVRLTNTLSIQCIDSSDSIEIGSWFQFKNTMASAVTLSGATFNLPQSTTPSIRPRGEVRLLKVGTNSWDVTGDLVTV